MFACELGDSKTFRQLDLSRQALFLTLSVRYNDGVVTVDKNPEGVMDTAEGRNQDIHELAVLGNEFASVRVALDERGNGPRLLVQDLESGAEILLSPLELASFCLATADDRLEWLRVGHYRDERAR